MMDLYSRFGVVQRPTWGERVVVALTWLSVIGAAAALILLFVPRAHGTAACMTVHEARAHWPNAHLYWHQSAAGRCWDDSRAMPHPVVKLNPLALPKDDKPPPRRTDANGNDLRNRIYDEDEFNSLDALVENNQPAIQIIYPAVMLNANLSTLSPMLRVDVMKNWPLLYDVDRSSQFIQWDRRISGAFAQ